MTLTLSRATRRHMIRSISLIGLSLAVAAPLHADDIPDGDALRAAATKINAQQTANRPASRANDEIPDADALMAALKKRNEKRAANPNTHQAKQDAYTRCVKKARKQAHKRKAKFKRFEACQSEADAILADYPDTQQQRMRDQAAWTKADAAKRERVKQQKDKSKDKRKAPK